MAVPQDKAALLAAIEKTHAAFVKELADIPPDRVSEPTLPGHAKDTMMSARDLVSYLIGWQEVVLKWHRSKAAGEPVDFPETGFKWNQLGLLAQKFYRDYAQLTFDELVDRLEAVHVAIIELVQSHNDDELYGRPWYDKYTMGRMIQFNTSSPNANARNRLRAWKKSEQRN